MDEKGHILSFVSLAAILESLEILSVGAFLLPVVFIQWTSSLPNWDCLRSPRELVPTLLQRIQMDNSPLTVHNRGFRILELVHMTIFTTLSYSLC